jgi:hypothetical protein
MDWNAKLDWAEEVYTLLVILPVPIIAVGVLYGIAPWLHRRSLQRKQPPRVTRAAKIEISGTPAGERT